MSLGRRTSRPGAALLRSCCTARAGRRAPSTSLTWYQFYLNWNQVTYEVSYASQVTDYGFGQKDPHLLDFVRGPLGARSVGAAPHCVMSIGHARLVSSLFPTHSATTTHNPHPVCWAALHCVMPSWHAHLVLLTVTDTTTNTPTMSHAEFQGGAQRRRQVARDLVRCRVHGTKKDSLRGGPSGGAGQTISSVQVRGLYCHPRPSWGQAEGGWQGADP